jgi:hypothetical protein
MAAGECSSASLAWSHPILNFLIYLIGKNLSDVNLFVKNIKRPVEKNGRINGLCVAEQASRFLADFGAQQRVKILPRPGLRAVRPDEPETAYRVIVLYGRPVLFVL